MGISVVLTFIFYLNIGNVNSNDLLPKRIADMGPTLDYLLFWAYLLSVLAVLFAIGFPAIQIFSNPKGGLKPLLAVVGIGVLMFIAYQLGDDTIMNIAGYSGPDNVPSHLKMTDMAIFSMYAMTAGAVIALLYSEISKLFK
ncbi:MAG: hypothetical protein D4R64_03295 [Porphyromonadaceae bacterium]|nr:MAG: hypothetical protein D4R64_03295 [Porphyromonadaceae bacterium]